MELHINEYQVTPEISFNFEELKTAVAERVSYYKDIVYTDEQIKEAKADRAQLRKFVDALDVRRKEIKTEILRPYTEFESKLDEIKALVNEPINIIDAQVKAYEDMQKKTKEASIRQTFENKGYSWMADVMWNPKWLNATYSMKTIAEEIDARIFNYEAHMKTLEALDEYRFEAIEEYKKTLDLGKAMLVVNQLKEQAKRKAAYEAEKAAEKTVEFLKFPQSPIEQMPMEIDVDDEDTEYHPPVREWISFKAYLSTEEAIALKGFFNSRNIEFKKI